MTDEEIEDAPYVDGLAEAKADIRTRLEKVLKDPDVQGDVRIRITRVTNMGEMPIGRVVHEQGDPIDKTITSFVVYAILAGLSQRLIARFPMGERAVGTASV